MILKNMELKIRAHKNISNVILIGMSGSGKSAIGSQLARRIGFGFLDLDRWIEKTAGEPVSKIFSRNGEPWFRDRESEALKSIDSISGHVIALGGGSLQKEENREIVSGLGITVWIDTPANIIAHRLARNPVELKKRPLLADIAKEKLDTEREQALLRVFSEQLEERQEQFREEALLTYSDGFASPDDAAFRITQLLESRTLQKSLKKKQKNKELLRASQKSECAEGE